MGCCKSSQTQPQTNEYQKGSIMGTHVDEDQIDMQIEIQKQLRYCYRTGNFQICIHYNGQFQHQIMLQIEYPFRT